MTITTTTLADEFRSAVNTLREAAESAARNGHRPGDRLLRTLADPVADWLESWRLIDFREDGPMAEDFKHALRVVRAINEGANHG